MDRLIKSGKGWRIGWNPIAGQFQGLVGSEEWCIELTEAEFNDFSRLLIQLADTMTYMANELMDEEKIACDSETDLLWMEVEGYPHSYSVQFMLNTGRRTEGYWPPSAIPGLLDATKILKLF
jgi:Domain of unknown function (DUF1818)